MMRHVMGTAFGIAATLAAASMAGAQPPFEPDRPPGLGPMFGPGPVAALGLTDEQRQQARQLFEVSRPSMQALFVRMRQNRRALEETAAAESPDATRIGELFLEGRRLREEGRAQREQVDAALKALLTPEQRSKFELLMTSRAIGMGRRGPEDMGPPEATGGGPVPR
jgi:Spy/CpxP family protein refolding chaperone